MTSQGPSGEGAGWPGGIREVKARHERDLLSLPGVVSVGIGRRSDGNPEIVVGLDRHRPSTLREIPRELEGYPVRAEVTGRARGF
ncbi:MAG TPA: hypothetical protein VMT31_08385 [Methanomicrobiales archaeon]|jgi:hypothetical protein|nr:hypothetical protein [Methanomicrobiales archaeon]